MKQIVTYQCSRCKSIFESQEECRKCEAGHVKPKRMINCSWAPYEKLSDNLYHRIGGDLDCTYPFMITVEMEDGEELSYKVTKVKKKNDENEKLRETANDFLGSIFDSALDKIKRKEDRENPWLS